MPDGISSRGLACPQRERGCEPAYAVTGWSEAQTGRKGVSRGVPKGFQKDESGFERMKAAYRRLSTFPGTRGRRRLSPVKLRNVAPQTKICGAIQTSLAVARDSVRASTLTGGLSCVSGVRIKWMACLCGRKAEKPQRSPQPPLRLLSDMLTAQRKQVES